MKICSVLYKAEGTKYEYKHRKGLDVQQRNIEFKIIR